MLTDGSPQPKTREALTQSVVKPCSGEGGPGEDWNVSPATCSVISSELLNLSEPEALPELT